ncbi:MAG: 4Fe-4S dicluster domain-containing protein [Sedimentisphaerales bacterium]|nr:4Fe-4S dicluster domain-containing protein [Sedimentisphaerales bacterium]
MAGKITIDIEKCKGCGLCVAVCPKGSIVISSESNAKGYFPARPTNVDCTGCGECAVVCPDAVITVYRDDSRKAGSAGQRREANGAGVSRG